MGFLSKFFGIFEPHGMLLDGIMKYLPRSRFFVIAMPVARTDGKPLAPTIATAVDDVVEIGLTHEFAMRTILRSQLDILVFADVLSEPLAHFLSQSRMAPIQAAFWGNPITSGSRQIDYFISADCMEHPFRNRMRLEDDPYTEQIVLLEGQGIWYYTPEDPKVALERVNIADKVQTFRDISNTQYRRELGLEPHWFLFFCPQSVFKIHPFFDQVLADILKATEIHASHAHIVVTGGRKEYWSNIYSKRLLASVNPRFHHRLHIIPRVSAEKFLDLIRIADLLLHPFPFDGSRTSADGLSVSIPYITMPTEYLRGRMGSSFYRTMNIPELVARNKSDYVDLAVRLATEKEYYSRLRSLVNDRKHLIWEDMEIPFRWSSFFSTAMGVPAQSWESFMAETDRNIAVETELFDLRNEMRSQFYEVYGNERWLLDDFGHAPMETTCLEIDDRDCVPRVFRDWKSPQREMLSSEELEYVRNFISMESIQMKEFKQLITKGQLEGAYNLGTTLLQKHKDVLSRAGQTYKMLNPQNFDNLSGTDPSTSLFEAQLLTSLGGLQYFRGNHMSAHELCKSAATVAKFSVVFGCMGVSALYLGMEEVTFNSLFESWRMVHETESRMFSDDMVFKMTPEALQYNLLQAANTFNRTDMCFSIGEEILSLPSMLRGGFWLVSFSFVSWSEDKAETLRQLEIRLRNSGLLDLSPELSFYSEILRIQKDHEWLLNSIYQCSFYDDRIQQLWQLVSDEMTNIMTTTTSWDQIGLAQNEIKREEGLVLITQFFESAEYQSDINYVLQNNLNNQAISHVVLLNEEDYDFSSFSNSSKILQLNLGHRLRFSDVFEFANANLDGRTVVLANSDIYFDESLDILASGRVDFQGRVFALAKWVHKSEKITLNLRTDSQDAWIFQPPLNESLVGLTGFDIGSARCDNVLAEVLHDSGHSPLNPCFLIHAIEVQRKLRAGKIYDTVNAVFNLPGRNLPLADISKIE